VSDVWAVMRQPKWLGMLLALPFLMGLCVVAANWQYDRHERRSAQEAQVAAAETAAPVSLESVLLPTEPLPASGQYTQVTVTGVYDQQAVLIRNRSLREERGMWVVNPLRLPDGSSILVLRGWMAATRDNVEQATAAAAPAGRVSVTGVLQPSEPRRGAGILSNGEATSLNIEAICPQGCYQAYLQLTSSEPPDAVPPVPVDGPGLGPHLGYAGQWLIFGLMLPIGYVILLRREVRETRQATQGALTR
jgi:cytochrome oxidase assembly protein ShyY1